MLTPQLTQKVVVVVILENLEVTLVWVVLVGAPVEPEEGDITVDKQVAVTVGEAVEVVLLITRDNLAE